VNHYYHPDAKREASAALAYYAAVSQQLGLSFLTELEDTIARIVNMPEAWTQHAAGTRRCLMHRFPYGIIYETESEAIRIIAVMHLHRKPAYWLNRIPTK
jgi:plasmid stabilization system protein ParE